MALTEGMKSARTIAELQEQIIISQKASVYEGVPHDFLNGFTVIEDKNPENDQAVMVHDNGDMDVRPYHNCDWA